MRNIGAEYAVRIARATCN